jgi:hypothetical protein
MKTVKRFLKFILRKNIDDRAFMEAVLLELNLLKKYLSKYEKEALDVNSFNESSWPGGIYGLTTGDGRSHRAKELMDKCVIVSCSGRYRRRRAYKGLTWIQPRLDKAGWIRDLSYLSALEGYLITLDVKSSEVKRVFDFLKDEIKSIELEGFYNFHNTNKKN